MLESAGCCAEFDLIVFDVTGTLVQDRGEIAAAFATALADSGHSVDPHQLNSLRGVSKRDALGALLGLEDSEQLDAVHGRFVETLAQSYRARGVTPIEGLAVVFSYFREQKLKIALNTGLDRAIMDVLLESLGWISSTFAAVVCGDDVTQGRPAPFLIHAAMRLAGVGDPRRVINVGDTVADLQAGSRAGVAVNVGVLSGAHTRAQLRRAPHTNLVKSVRDLPALIADMSARL